MYSQIKNVIIYINTAVLISLLNTSAAMANVYEIPQTKPEVLNDLSIPSPSQNPAVLAPLRFVEASAGTTLHLTQAGLGRLSLEIDASGLPLASFSLSSLAVEPARDRITTASIPATTAPVGTAVSRAIRQDRPLFGAHRIRFGKIKSGVRISGLIRKAAASGASAICVERCARLAARLELVGADFPAQLRHVSASVNALVTYRTDQQNHGRLDQWSTPNETIARASGDCEDYAILKMAILAHLGVPVNAMEIVVVKDTRRRLFHAVLSVALNNRTVILDNMTDAVEADTEKSDYAPLFSLSGTANYVFGYKGGKQNLTASLGNIASIAPGAGF
jgi:predicted transglutaminase-like cysteine proteinase